MLPKFLLPATFRTKWIAITRIAVGLILHRGKIAVVVFRAIIS